MVYEQFLAAVKKNVWRQSWEAAMSWSCTRFPKTTDSFWMDYAITRGNAHIAPAIYLNPCYDQYRKGMSLDQIVAELPDHVPPERYAASPEL